MRAAAALLLVVAGAFAGHGRLAYVSRGSLYVLDGSRVVPVTAGGASAPAFSPDGRWLSYAYRGRVGLAHSDGTHPRALRAPSASWLPNGELRAGASLYRVAPNGSPVRVGPAPAGLVAWAADGSRYAFVVSRGGRNGVELLQAADTPTGPRTTWLRVPQRFTARSGYESPAIANVVVLPGRRGLLVALDPLHSASIAADGVPVYALAAPGASLRKLGTTVYGTASVAGGRFALGGGFDRYAWRTKHVLTCTVRRCVPLPSPKGVLTLDPALSPNGTLAYVTARQESADDFFQRTLRRWYATRRLRVGDREIPGSAGAAAPTWSRDGKSLLFVKDDFLWLLPRVDAKPVRVAGPLFPPDAWPSYYGQVDWSQQFAWSP